MSKNVLIVMCGLPASGKSTYTKWLTESGVFCSVCPDSIRKELYGDEDIQGDGKQVFGIAHYRMQMLGLSKNNVVFDATNIDRKTRKDLIKKMQPCFDVIICKWFSTPLLTCKLRNSQRKRQVPEEMLDSMYERFRAPMIDEGFDLVEEVKNYF